MNSLSATFESKITASGSNTLDLGTGKLEISIRQASKLVTGTGANQANQAWSDKRSLAATSEDLDLSGVLTNALGESVTFSKIKAIVIRNLSSTAGQVLTVGGASSNPVSALFGAGTHTLKIGPGGCASLVNPIDGYTVTGGTADQLKIDSGAATFDYEITIIGVN